MPQSLQGGEPPADDRGGKRRLLASLRSGTGIRIEILLVVVGVVAAIALSPKLRGFEGVGLIELSELGALAPLVLVQAYAVVSLLFLPAFPLDMAAGAHFGFLEGVFWVQVAATTGSALGYLLGRSVLRRFVDRLLQRKAKLRRVQLAVVREGWRVVFLTRLSPVFSFSLLNVFYGAARVPFLPYLLASTVGMLPGTALYVYAGLMAGDLSGAPGHPAPSSGHWLVEAGGFAVTAAIVVLITRYASRVLDSSMEPEPQVGMG